VILTSRWTCRVQGIKRDIDAGNMGSNFTVHLLHFVATRTHVNFTWGRTGNEEWKVERRRWQLRYKFYGGSYQLWRCNSCVWGLFVAELLSSVSNDVAKSLWPQVWRQSKVGGISEAVAYNMGFWLVSTGIKYAHSSQRLLNVIHVQAFFLMTSELHRK